MKKRDNSTRKILSRCTKSNNVQQRVFREYLRTNTATCSMATEATGIPQKCLTRYKRELEKQGDLIEVFHAPCVLTGFRATYLSTNPTLIKSLHNGNKAKV